MLSGNSGVITVYVVLYVLLCVPTVLYLRRKGADRKMQIGMFVAMTSALVVAVSQRLGLFPEFGKNPPILVSFLGMLAISVWPCYRLRSLGTFLLSAVALGTIATYSEFMDFFRSRGVSDTSERILSYFHGAIVFGLLLSTVIVACRAYLNRRAMGD